MTNETMLLLGVGLILALQALGLLMLWLKYQHQMVVESRIVRMERILDIADRVLFNQRRFVPLVQAVADIHEWMFGSADLATRMRADVRRLHPVTDHPDETLSTPSQ